MDHGETGGDESLCAICLEMLTPTTTCTLPCTHSFHGACVTSLRAYGVAQACPMCRATLPPGPDQLFFDATRRFVALEKKVERGYAAWSDLTEGELAEMVGIASAMHGAAEQGHSNASFVFGYICEQGRGVEPSLEKARHWYGRASAGGVPSAMFNLSLITPDNDEAESLCRAAASAGNPGAQYSLGVSLERQALAAAEDTGESTSSNPIFSEAVWWYRKSAYQGYARAQLNLGGMYYGGRGVGQNLEEAAKWYRKSANKGLPGGQYDLGVLFFRGKGVRQSNLEAAKWWRLAADQGHVKALLNLGKLILREFQMKRTGAILSRSPTIGGYPVTAEVVAELFRNAAEQGMPQAQFQFGHLHAKGLGVKHSHTAAARWYGLAAEQGDAKACYMLGVCFERGRGVDQSDSTAVKFFRRAADQRLPHAQACLARFLDEGRGVVKSPEKASKWRRRAEAQGYSLEASPTSSPPSTKLTSPITIIGQRTAADGHLASSSPPASPLCSSPILRAPQFEGDW